MDWAFCKGVEFSTSLELRPGLNKNHPEITKDRWDHAPDEPVAENGFLSG